jgi:hypothetical protein
MTAASTDRSIACTPSSSRCAASCPSSGLHGPDPKETSAALERRYYLDFPGVTTLRDFAARLADERTFR